MTACLSIEKNSRIYSTEELIFTISDWVQNFYNTQFLDAPHSYGFRHGEIAAVEEVFSRENIPFHSSSVDFIDESTLCEIIEMLKKMSLLNEGYEVETMAMKSLVRGWLLDEEKMNR